MAPAPAILASRAERRQMTRTPSCSDFAHGVADDSGRFDSVGTPGGGQGDLRGEQDRLYAGASADGFACAHRIEHGKSGLGEDEGIDFGESGQEGGFLLQQAESHPRPLRPLPGEHPYGLP
jgi:hypothetical protein